MCITIKHKQTHKKKVENKENMRALPYARVEKERYNLASCCINIVES